MLTNFAACLSPKGLSIGKVCDWGIYFFTRWSFYEIINEWRTDEKIFNEPKHID